MASPLLLSFSTVFALIGIVLAAIAFGTDNWHTYKVDRQLLFSKMETNNNLRRDLLAGNAINTTNLYFTRILGYFHECYENEVPTGSNAEKGPLGGWCITRKNEYLPETEEETKLWNSDQWTRMHLMRTAFGFYVTGLSFLLLTLFTGIAGCWMRHAGMILGTGILLLFATLFLAASMAVWHGVDYLTRDVINVWPYEKSWPTHASWLLDVTRVTYGWSYIIAWIAIGLILIASLLMLAAYRSMKDEEADEYEKKTAPYMMASYYDKSALMPYNAGGYAGTYPAGGYGYPAAGGYPGYPMAAQGYGGGYGYMTYGR